MQTDYITIPLGLEEFQVIGSFKTDFFSAATVEKKSSGEVCPHCGKLSQHIHDRRWQRVKDISALGMPVMLSVCKRRFRCRPCNRVFLESYESLPRYARMTERFTAELWADPMQSFRAVARRFKVSEGVARSTFLRYAKGLVGSYGQEPFAVLSIDENSFRKKLHFNTILADWGRSRVVDILPGHKKEPIVEWLRAFPYRHLIRYLVIDLCRGYKNAVQEVCPKVTIVADKFHLVRQLNENLIAVKEKYFRRGQAKTPPPLRWWLVSARENLRDDQKQKLDEVLKMQPDLAKAYTLKEQFRSLYSAKTYLEADHALVDFVFAAAQSGLPDFIAFSRTVRRWWHPILSWFDLPISNGYLEGTNNKLKLIKRISYGYRSFETFRLKGLVNCGKLVA